MTPENAIAVIVGALISVCVGSVLFALRRAALHRDKTHQHATAIAVMDTRLLTIDHKVDRISESLERMEVKVDSLDDCRCHYRETRDATTATAAQQS